MSKSPSGPDHTVRPSSSRAPSKVFCVLGFVAAASLVLWWGRPADLSAESAKRHTATAKIYRQVGFPPGITATDASVARLARLWNPVPEHEATQVASEAVLLRGQVATDIAAVRKNLQVTASKASGSGTLEIAITYTDSHADRCVRLVNRLAESYAADFRARWQSRAREVCVEAGNAAESARQTLLEAQQQLDTPIDRHADTIPSEDPSERKMSEQIEATRPGIVEDIAENAVEDAVEETVVKEPAMVDNPEWLDLQSQLAEVRLYRDDLLIDRTELHPMVQEAEMRVSALEQRIASIPGQIPGQVPDASLASPQRSATNLTDEETPTGQTQRDRAASLLAEQQRAAALQQRRELERTTKQANEAYRMAMRKERTAWETGQLAPRIELNLARMVDAPTPQRPGSTVLLATLIAGVAGAAGAGMVSLGWAMEPTLNTVAQVDRAISFPVIGVVSESGLPGDRHESSDQRRWLRPVLIVGGLILVGGLVTMAINMVEG